MRSIDFRYQTVEKEFRNYGIIFHLCHLSYTDPLNTECYSIQGFIAQAKKMASIYPWKISAKAH